MQRPPGAAYHPPQPIPWGPETHNPYTEYHRGPVAEGGAAAWLQEIHCPFPYTRRTACDHAPLPVFAAADNEFGRDPVFFRPWPAPHNIYVPDRRPTEPTVCFVIAEREGTFTLSGSKWLFCLEVRPRDPAADDWHRVPENSSCALHSGDLVIAQSICSRFLPRVFVFTVGGLEDAIRCAPGARGAA